MLKDKQLIFLEYSWASLCRTANKQKRQYPESIGPNLGVLRVHTHMTGRAWSEHVSACAQEGCDMCCVLCCLGLRFLGTAEEKQREGGWGRKCRLKFGLSSAGMMRFRDGIGTINWGVICLCICTCSHFRATAVLWMLSVSQKSTCEEKANPWGDTIGTWGKP